MRKVYKEKEVIKCLKVKEKALVANRAPLETPLVRVETTLQVESR